MSWTKGTNFSIPYHHIADVLIVGQLDGPQQQIQFMVVTQHGEIWQEYYYYLCNQQQ